jgi:ApbE superfamily uncharacterized protein (UPF0280 family)
MKREGYQPRVYRQWVEGKDLISFSVSVKETDLYIRAVSNLQRKARRLVLKYRRQLESYVEKEPLFLTSLEPLKTPASAPEIVTQMIEAGQQAGVGPMAAVAGAIAECVGRELTEFSPEVIVENGGDIFLKLNRKRTVGIYAGESPLTGKLGLEIGPDETPLGVCTSSGTVGHSLSFGKADAVVVVSNSAALADATATAIGNRVGGAKDIGKAIDFGRTIVGVNGLVIVVGGDFGVWGNIRLCEIAR